MTTSSFSAGWLEKQDYDYAFAPGLSAGSATAFSEGLADAETIWELYRNISGT